MLWGFMSQWTMPFSWIWLSADSIWHENSHRVLDKYIKNPGLLKIRFDELPVKYKDIIIKLLEGNYEEYQYPEEAMCMFIGGLYKNTPYLKNGKYNITRDFITFEKALCTAAYVAGIKLVCSDAMGEWTGLKGIGTMPHALIIMHEKDLIAAAEDFHKAFPNDNLTVLVDTNNDVITDTLLVARHFKEKLFGVRVDTSISLVDKYFDRNPVNDPSIETHGVNVTLIKALRKALDDEGFNHVKIVVSSGFTAEKVALFTKENAPVDTYGVGGSLIKCTRSFTGDVVNINGKDVLNNVKFIIII